MTAEGKIAIRPPAVHYYRERRDEDPGWIDEAGRAVVGALAGPVSATSLRFLVIMGVRAALREAGRLRALDDAQFNARIAELRLRIRRAGLTRRSKREGVALVSEMVFRELGIAIRPGQIRGALAMLRGHLIEMDTGEGKTMTAALAAGTAAMAGIPVHVITVNNYLAARDVAQLTPIYRRLGLRTGLVAEKAPPEERRAAYACEIVYGSNTEIAFDYLRDRIAFGPDGPRGLRQRLRRVTGTGSTAGEPVMSGLHMAIVDEADSVLVDEARTPLIISRQTDPDDEAAWANRALDLARGLERGRHYKVLGEDRRVQLTDRGREALASRCAGEDGIWQSAIRRQEVIAQALSALIIFKRGEHYLVHDGKVQIVDEYTGRLQPDRSWSDGLHQLIEAKEGAEVTGQNLAIARMTYQRFFRRYVFLAGMTGTAREVAEELRSVYDLPVERVPPHRPSKLRFRRPRVYRTARAKWAAVAAETARVVAAGRPVLIGTRSVAASQSVSSVLTDAGLDHVVLNAEHDAEEAEIIAAAGGKSRITVATNMAGRGVDIALAPGVAELGGLHVIITERHDAGRIDRQLAGRAGRRSEPGSVSTLLSLQDPLLEVLDAPVSKLLARIPLVSAGLRLRLIENAQRRAERSHARMRKDLVRQDRRTNQLLSFAGGLE